MSKYFTYFSVILLLASFSLLARANIDVELSFEHAEHHYVDVNIKLPPLSTNSEQLHLPIWRTGRYQVLNLANGIRQFKAVNANADLQWQKIDKDTWQVTGDLSNGFSVSYRVYANQLAMRTRHVDDSHAFIDASSVVMYSERSRSLAHTVSLIVPEGWRSVSGLMAGQRQHQFIAQDYDVLVDSPIETGINSFYEFEVDGKQYELVTWGKGNYNSDMMVADLKKLVAQGKAIWSNYPFERYVFMVHATSGARGATEHLNSTIIQRSRFKFSQREDYLGFLTTAAHEFVHTWNVKQYRPKGLVPYDYQSENYSNLLWLAEGSTSYLQYQLLLRGELMTAQEWLKQLAKRINGYMRKPGRNMQSIADASFNKWIDEGGDYGKNHSTNIYSEGFLVSWMLDADIIESTGFKKSYRDIHNMLSEQFAIPKTFTDQDVKALLKSLTGKSYQDWWQTNIDGFAMPDFNKLLNKAGLEISYGAIDKRKAWTGISTAVTEGGLKVIAVERSSPAWQSGLTTDDIIIAVDGLRVTGKSLNNRLKDFTPDQSVSVTFFRRDQLMEKNIVLKAMPAGKLTVKVINKPSRKQRAFFKAWTGLKLPK